MEKVRPNLDLLTHINPLLEWKEDQTQGGPGSYLGYKSRLKPKNLKEAASKKLLYPFYNLWCEQRGIIPQSHVLFTQQLCQFPEIKKNKQRMGFS